MKIVIETVEQMPTLKQLTAEYIRIVYEKLGRNKVKTAKVIGVSVRSLRIWQTWLKLPPGPGIVGGDGLR